MTLLSAPDGSRRGVQHPLSLRVCGGGGGGVARGIFPCWSRIAAGPDPASFVVVCYFQCSCYCCFVVLVLLLLLFLTSASSVILHVGQKVRRQGGGGAVVVAALLALGH